MKNKQIITHPLANKYCYAGLKNISLSYPQDNTRESLEDWAEKIYNENRNILISISKKDFTSLFLDGNKK